jgi:hypothetical protein
LQETEILLSPFFFVFGQIDLRPYHVSTSIIKDIFVFSESFRKNHHLDSSLVIPFQDSSGSLARYLSHLSM